MRGILLLFFILIGAHPDAGASDIELLIFSKWKDAQVNEARNRIVRLENQQLVRESAKFSVSSKQQMTSIEKGKQESALRLAKRSEEVARGLTLEDYISLYLVKYSSHKKALKELVSKMSDEEIAEFIQLQLNLANELDVKVSNRQNEVESLRSSKVNPWKTL